MHWQRSSSGKKYAGQDKEPTRVDPIIRLSHNNDFLTDDETTRLKMKLDNIKGKLAQKDGTIEQYHDQINDLNDIIREMKEKNTFKTNHKKPQNSSQNIVNNRNRPYISQDKQNPKQNGNQEGGGGGSDGSIFPQDMAHLKQKMLSQEIQIETLEQICDLLKHKNKAIESEVSHLRKMLLEPEKSNHHERENLLKQALDQVFAMNQQIKQMNKNYARDVESLVNDKKLLQRENDIIRQQMLERRSVDPKYRDPEGKRVLDLIDLIDDFKDALDSKQQQLEQQMIKNALQTRYNPPAPSQDDENNLPTRFSASNGFPNNNNNNNRASPMRRSANSLVEESLNGAPRHSLQKTESDLLRNGKSYNGIRDTIQEARKDSNEPGKANRNKKLRSSSRERERLEPLYRKSSLSIDPEDPSNPIIRKSSEISQSQAPSNPEELIEKLLLTNKELQAKKRECDDWKSQVADQKQEIEEKRKDLEDKRKDLDEKKKQLEEQQKEIDQLKRKLKQKQEEIERLSKEPPPPAKNTNNNERSNSIKEMQNELDEAKIEVDQLRNRIKNLENGTKQPKSQQDKEIEELQNLNRELRNQLRPIQTESENLQGDLNQSKTEAANAQAEVKQMKAEREALSLQNQDQEKKIKQLLNEKSQSKQEIQDLNNQLKDLKQKLKDLNDERSAAEDEHETQTNLLRDKFKQAEIAKEELQIDVEQKDREIKELKSQLTRKEMDLKEMEKQIKEIEKKIRDQKEVQRAELEKKLIQERKALQEQLVGEKKQTQLQLEKLEREKELQRLEKQKEKERAEREKANRQISTLKDYQERIRTPLTDQQFDLEGAKSGKSLNSARRRTNPSKQQDDDENSKNKIKAAQSSEENVSLPAAASTGTSDKALNDIIINLQDLQDEVKRQRQDNQVLQFEKEHFKKVVMEVYSTIKEYYQQVVNDPERLQNFLMEIDEAERQQRKKESKAAQVLRDLLLRKDGEELNLKNSVIENLKKSRNLEIEKKIMEEQLNDESKQLKKENLSLKGKVAELEVEVKILQKRIDQEVAEKEGMVNDFESQRSNLASRIKNLGTDMHQTVDNTEAELKKLQQQKENNHHQSKQIMKMLNEQQQEIATLQIRLINTEDELRRLRRQKMNQSDGPNNQSFYSVQSNSNEKLGKSQLSGLGLSPRTISPQSQSVLVATIPQVHDYKGNIPEITNYNYMRESGRQETEELLKQKPQMKNSYAETIEYPLARRDTQRLQPQTSVDNSSQRVPTDSLLQPKPRQQTTIQKQKILPDVPLPNNTKIQHIQNYKEWLTYWNYYEENPSCRLDLINHLMHTESIKDQFVNSRDSRNTVIKQALDMKSSGIYEMGAVLMAEVNEMNRLSYQDIFEIEHTTTLVKCLRKQDLEESETIYNAVTLSSLKMLSFYDGNNVAWTKKLSQEAKIRHSVDVLADYIKQNAREWHKLLSLNVLYMIAQSKLMNQEILNTGVIHYIISHLEGSNPQIQIGMLSCLSLLFQDDAIISAFSHPTKFLVLIQLLNDSNHYVVSYALDIIHSIIPRHQYQQNILNQKVLTKINDIALNSAYPTARSHAMDVLQQCLQESKDSEAEMINETCYTSIMKNIDIPEKQNLTNSTPQKELLHKTLQVLRILVEDQDFPEEQRLCTKIMRLFSNPNLHNDAQIEQLTLDIINILWVKIQPILLNNLNDNDVIHSIVEGYIQSKNVVEILNYGKMVSSICQKDTYVDLILESRGDQLVDRVLDNSSSADNQVSTLSSKIFSYLIQDSQTIQFMKEHQVIRFMQILGQQGNQEQLLINLLDSTFYMLKQYQIMRIMIEHEIMDILMEILDETRYSSTVIIQCFSCIEMIHNLYREQNILRDMCVLDEQNGPMIIMGFSNVCQRYNLKDVGLSSLFFWRFIAKESSSNDFISTVIKSEPDKLIQSLVKLKQSYRNTLPEIVHCVNQIFTSLSIQNMTLRDIIVKKDVE